MLKRIFVAVLVFAFVSLALAAGVYQGDVPVQQRQEIEKAIIDLHSRLQAAAGKVDVDALYADVLDTDKGSITEGVRVAATRKDALERTRQAFATLQRISYSYAPDRRYITVISPTAALWVAEGTSSATLSDSREINSSFAETIVFIKTDGAWKVLHAHRSAPVAR